MLALIALPLLLPATLPQDPVELLSEALPDGGWVEREVERGPDGEAINHGSYKSWWDATREIPRASGRYTHGLKRATWRTYYADKGRASKGKYEQDLRTGNWDYWSPDGEPDDERSGRYSVATLEHANGQEFAHGELREGVRQGRWILTWPNGVHMAEGHVQQGQPAGVWVLHHPDGTPDPDWVSGDYSAGVRIRALAPEQRAALTSAPADAPAANALAGPVSIAGRQVDVHDALRNLLRLELTDAEQVAIGTRLVGQLVEATGGYAFEWREGATPEDAAVNRLSILRWTSFWTMMTIHPDYANFGFVEQAAKLEPVAKPEPAAKLEPGDELDPAQEVKLLEALHPPLLSTDWAAEPARIGPLAVRFEHSPRSGKSGHAVEATLDAALDWLVRHQTPEGSWSSAGFAGTCPVEGALCNGPGEEYNDLGVTALSLLALLGDGNTTRTGPHSDTLVRGLTWLLAKQERGTGLYGKHLAHSTIYQHGIATLVVCEAALLSGDPVLLESAQRGVDFIHMTRNPYGAWRYEIPPIGKSDTSITGWMVQALDAAARAGLYVDEDALAGALSWIEEMTDSANGRTGYANKGSFSARVEGQNDHYPLERAEALTGVALFSRLLLGQRLKSTPILAQQADLLMTKLPYWDPAGFGCDMYAWFYGTNAIYQMGGSHWAAWERALENALTGSQRQDGHAAGSWDPVGPWGFAGGRVYATALMALCLEAPHRLARLSELDEEQ